LKELLKQSSLLGVGKVAGIAINLVRVKVSAIFLGADGVGILSQILYFKSILNKVMELGIGSGVTKYTAEYWAKGDDETLRALMRSAIMGFGMLGLTICLCTCVLAKLIAGVILDDQSLYYLIMLIGVGVILEAQLTVYLRIFQGLLKMKLMVAVSLTSTLVGVITAIPLIIYLNVLGAILGILVTSLIMFFIGRWQLKNALGEDAKEVFRMSLPDKTVTKNLLKFGGANSTVFLSNMLSLLAVRSIIIDRYGADSNGLYQVATGVATQYVGIVAVAIWQYGMPKVATMMGQKTEIQQLQNDATRLGLLILTPVIIGLLASREIWIPILYSNAFIGAYGLVGWQLFGELIRSIKWGPNMVNQPYERYTFIVFQSFANAIIFLGAFWLLLPSLGVLAAPVAYCINQSCLVLIALVGHYYYDRFKFELENFGLIASSIALVSATMYVSYNLGSVTLIWAGVIAVAAVVWLLVVIRASEKSLILDLLMKRKGK
jgi:O-antigen/teichoic acid export membrane protein